MRIVFNLNVVGLGNNGGSRTLIKCAEALKDLGCEVFICSPTNRYTWHHIRVEVVPRIPKCDVIIATGFHSVHSTLIAKKARKFYYVRGFELWQAKESKLLKSYRSMQCIVNSEWLQQYMADNGIEAHLVYPGVDLGDFRNDENDRERIIGGIFSKKHKTKHHDDVIAIGETLKCKTLLLNRDIKNPKTSDLRDFYNKIKVWISPSELEGLHNCPMESSLCGCGLVSTNHPRGGTADYAINKQTALVYPDRNIEKAAEYVDKLFNDDAYAKSLNQNMCTLLREKIGDRKTNMKRLLKIFRGQK